MKGMIGKMEKLNWEESYKSLMDEYEALLKRAEKMIDRIKTLNHGGVYILYTKEVNGKQWFNNLHEAIEEVKFNQVLGLKSYLKYEVK